MTRCKRWIAFVALLIVATALATAAVPQEADAATSLRARLRLARLELREAALRLSAARAALAATLAASAALPAPSPTPAESPSTESSPDPTSTPAVADTASPTPTPEATPDAAGPAVAVAATPSAETLRARISKARRAVVRWRVRVRRLAKRYHEQQLIAYYERHGQWKPIIAIAAKRYGVSASAIHAMMLRESGGRRYAGSTSMFKGLFQYYPGTWRASWNPWRADSIFDGSSQIFATCYAVSRGYGPQMWPNTYYGH